MLKFIASNLVSIMENNNFSSIQISKMLQYATFYNTTHFKMNRSSIDIYFNNPNFAFNMIRCHRKDNSYYNTTNFNNNGIVAGLKEIWSQTHTTQSNSNINIGNYKIKTKHIFIPLP